MSWLIFLSTMSWPSTLNQLTSVENVQLELSAFDGRFQNWLGSSEEGYFFLDAVDEARLSSTSALQTALRSVVQVLRPNLKRSHFFISSRITDWSVPAVRETVDRTLLKPVLDTEVVTEVRPISTTQTLDVISTKGSTSTNLEVFSLDPLSLQDAKKFAEAHGASPVDVFWSEVIDGGYEFMATRPLDLEWMAKSWSVAKRLGSYSELIELAVSNRLTEFNPSYIESRAVLSPDRLRLGAEQVAAACVFSGRPYVLVLPNTSNDSAVFPLEALPDWEPIDAQRLLGTAVFDEATYGRVKFHHRAVREYLAACWVERKLNEGLPLRHALDLFIRAPYGESVLLNSRKGVLCWLATINAQVRERVIQQFPEMLMFEGDPQRWSDDDVVIAFTVNGYILRLESGYQPNWWNDASELRRVGKKLPPKLLVDLLSRYSKSPEISYRLLSLIKHAKIMSCADAVFAIYRTEESSLKNRDIALNTLSAVATPAQRADITQDLVKGELEGNELIASALGVVGLNHLTADQLRQILDHTGAEPEYGAGPMVSTIKYDLLPTLDLRTSHVLLSAIVGTLDLNDIKKISRRAEAGKCKEAWMLTVLPQCVLRAIELIADEVTDTPQVLLDAALVVEQLRDTMYADDNDFRSLRVEIEKRPAFRQRIALAIACSGGIRHAATRLTMLPGLVRFTLAELEWLVREANRGDIESAERQIWYEIACDIAHFTDSGTRGKKALTALSAGPDKQARIRDIELRRAGRRRALAWHRRQKRNEEQRKAQRLIDQRKNKSALVKNIAIIRDSTGVGYIQWLVQYSSEQSSERNFTKVNLVPIVRDFGDEIAAALSEGLTKFWRQTTPPNPADYPDNQIPWSGLIGLAGVNHEVSLGLDVLSLSSEEITRAVQFIIWEFEKLEPWVERLSQTCLGTIATALMPWFEHELESVTDDKNFPRIINRVLNFPTPLQQPFLERALELMRDGKIPYVGLQKKLLRAMGKSRMAPVALVTELASRHLKEYRETGKRNAGSEWFEIWAAVDFVGAWAWMEANAGSVAKDSPDLTMLVAEALESSDWVNGLSGTEAETNALVSLFGFLVHRSNVVGSESVGVEGSHAIPRIRDSIPRILASQKGEVAHRALEKLVREQAGAVPVGWLRRFVTEHASADAERDAIIPPGKLRQVGEVYCRDTGTERELFEQVAARLEDIRERIEGGPFSDRVLFRAGMEEKHLQLWLAARLDDTPRRRFISRFVVHREPQVDNEKRTDIEVSNRTGKVCIEIKPVDSMRRYSAKTLTGTLRNQLVEQYLRGQNSHHGILVLFRLDKKIWRIPNMRAMGTFDQLIEYLNEQAEVIKTECTDVEKLLVFGINCVPAS